MNRKIFQEKPFLVLLAFINIAAATYSLKYYLPQLFSTSPLFWVFVPDSIVAVFAFGISMLLFAHKRLPEPVAAFSIIAMAKQGAWTLAVLFLGGAPFISHWYFYAGHAIMILETAFLFRKFKFLPMQVMPALGFFLVNDLLDYFYGMHPPLPQEHFIALAAFSFALTIALPIIVWKTFSSGKKLGEK